MNRKRLRLVLAEDNELMLNTMMKRLLLDFDVIGAARNGVDAVEVVQALKPDALVIDVTMPILGGIQALRTMREAKLDVPPTVMVSTHNDISVVREALASGAFGYVLKSRFYQDASIAILRAMSRMTFVSEPLFSEMRLTS
ncbi:MAG TPA: response regulator transcription factor [Terriglobales bacterium]|jgi:response regulator NasT